MGCHGYSLLETPNRMVLIGRKCLFCWPFICSAFGCLGGESHSNIFHLPFQQEALRSDDIRTASRYFMPVGPLNSDGIAVCSISRAG